MPCRVKRQYVRGRPVSRILYPLGRARGVMTIPLDDALPRRLKLPTRTCSGESGPASDLATLGTRSLFGIAPGGACHARAVASPAVGSCPTVSPLPAPRRVVCFLWRCPSGCRRVAPPIPPGRYPAPSLSGVRTFLDGSDPPRSSGLPRVLAVARLATRRQGSWWGRGSGGSLSGQVKRDQVPEVSGPSGMKSSASSGPVAQGRNRKRTDASSVSKGTLAV